MATRATAIGILGGELVELAERTGGRVVTAGVVAVDELVEAVGVPAPAPGLVNLHAPEPDGEPARWGWFVGAAWACWTGQDLAAVVCEGS